MKIRYHLDEHVHGGIAEGLRRRGIDVTTAASANLISASDEEHLAFAKLQGRVVVTHDPDFLRFSTRKKSSTTASPSVTPVLAPSVRSSAASPGCS